LPVEPVVALMSAEHRFALGAGLLIAPLLAGLIGFLADWVSCGDVQKVTLLGRQLRAVVAVLLGAAVVFFVLKPPWETFLAESLAVAIALPFAFHLLNNKPETRHSFRERLVVFLAVLGATGAGAILAEAMLRAPSFDEARVTVRDQSEPVTGGYITSTEHSVVLATSCELIQAVPRDLIVGITVGPDKHAASQC
jgi:MFS family permease